MASLTITQLVFEQISKITGVPVVPEGGLEITPGRTDPLWNVLSSDTEKGQYLLHYTNGNVVSDVLENKPEYAGLQHLRGTIVDIKNERKICASFPYTPLCTTISLPSEGAVTLNDSYGKKHTFDVNKSTFEIGFEGPLARVFWYDGELQFSTHRNRSALRSHWGDSETFYNLYQKLGAPKAEEMFDTKKTYSPWVHYFIICHNSLMMSSKMEVGEGFLVYLGSSQMYTQEQVEDPENHSWENLYQGKTVPLKSVDASGNPIVPIPSPEGTQIFSPAKIPVSVVNTILQYGYHSDKVKPEDLQSLPPILWPGEFVIARTEDGKMLKICSPAYNYRCEIRGNNPNLRNQFYLLIDHSYLDKDAERKKFAIARAKAIAESGLDFASGLYDGLEGKIWTYGELFPYVATPTTEEFSLLSGESDGQARGYVLPPCGTPEQLERTTPKGFEKGVHLSRVNEAQLHAWRNTLTSVEGLPTFWDPRDLRQRNICVLLALSVPLGRQKEVFGIYNQFIQERENFVQEICREYNNLLKMKEEKTLTNDAHWDRIFVLAAKAKRYVEIRRQNRKDRLKQNGRQMTDHELMVENFRNLIFEELGRSLYKMIRTHRKWVAEKTRVSLEQAKEAMEAVSVSASETTEPTPEPVPSV